MRGFRLELGQLIRLLARTLDRVGVDDFLHGRRVGMIAVKLARELGWDPAARQRIYEAGLLHDCGVSTTREHRRLGAEVHWAGAQAHCLIGAARLAGFPPLARLAPLVRWHHTPWRELEAAGCPPEAAPQANLLFLADRIDVLAARRGADPGRPEGVEGIRSLLAQYRGSSFRPEALDAFLRVSEAPAFWAELRSEPAVEAFQEAMAGSDRPSAAGPGLDWADFRKAARLLQEIVDAKSPFTYEHSLGVARLARRLAEAVGLPEERCEQVEVAGLLHDLGKMQVPDELLEAPRPLTAPEFDTMRAHSFATLDLLRAVDGLEEITRWASSHHEKLDGSGYPFGLRGADLPLEARIITVADLYQALAQNRPYRGALPPEVILAMLRERAEAGAIDGDLVARIARDPLPFHRAAIGLPEPEAAAVGGGAR